MEGRDVGTLIDRCSGNSDKINNAIEKIEAIEKRNIRNNDTETIARYCFRSQMAQHKNKFDIFWPWLSSR